MGSFFDDDGGPTFASAGVREVSVSGRRFLVDLSSLGLLHYSSTGEVRIAQDAASGCQFAAKLVSREGVDTSRVSEEEEISLRHPAVVETIGVWQSDDALLRVYVTELCTGGELLDSLIESGNGMDEQLAKRHIRRAVSALFYIHARGLAHTHLRPCKVLVDAAGCVKLSVAGCLGRAADLGTAEQAVRAALSTGVFAAPELLALAEAGGEGLAAALGEAQRRTDAHVAKLPAGSLGPCVVSATVVEQSSAWSLGMLALALTHGNVPFEVASSEADERFAAFCKCFLAPPHAAPFALAAGSAVAELGLTPMSEQQIEFLRRTLALEPTQRSSLAALMANGWLEATRPAAPPPSQAARESAPSAPSEPPRKTMRLSPPATTLGSQAAAVAQASLEADSPNGAKLLARLRLASPPGGGEFDTPPLADRFGPSGEKRGSGLTLAGCGEVTTPPLLHRFTAQSKQPEATYRLLAPHQPPPVALVFGTPEPSSSPSSELPACKWGARLPTTPTVCSSPSTASDEEQLTDAAQFSLDVSCALGALR
ncbi:kinase-like domain-containing protein [Pavlovales sp. CCMP2436]|nr:kinase-like domain-containing protein [Pavlovales sp. CCMP2436]